METFSMVVLGREYVTTYCWRPGVPTRYYYLGITCAVTFLHMDQREKISNFSSIFALFTFSHVAG